MAAFFDRLALVLACARRWRSRRAARRRRSRLAQVGERYDGYMGFAAPPRPRSGGRSRRSTSGAATSTSSLRARRNVDQPAAGRTADRLPAASPARRSAKPIMLHDGAWRRWAPGQPAPGAAITAAEASAAPRLTIRSPVHKGAAPWRCCFSAMFLVPGLAPGFQQGRRTGETHGRGRNRRGPEASTRRAARIRSMSGSTGCSRRKRKGPAKRQPDPTYRVGQLVLSQLIGGPSAGGIVIGLAARPLARDRSPG